MFGPALVDGILDIITDINHSAPLGGLVDTNAVRRLKLAHIVRTLQYLRSLWNNMLDEAQSAT